MSQQQILSLGAFLALKARVNADQSGIRQAARNLRKQGIPLVYAVAILATKG